MTIRHKTVEIGGKTFLRCRSCGELKELSVENRSRDKNAKLGFLYRCKECMRVISKDSQKRYRESHKKEIHEYNIKYHVEHRDEQRAKRRQSYSKEKLLWKKRYDDNREKYNLENKNRRMRNGYRGIHCKVSRLIKKLGIRPKQCPMCGYEGRVVAHHPDYSKIYEIVFCCPSCHQLIHNGVLNVDKNKILNLKNY